MTTQEKLLAEAQEFAAKHVSMEWTDEDVADFALSQLRAAKESGHLRHKENCAKLKREATHVEGLPDLEPQPCDCGMAEKWGDLL